MTYSKNQMRKIAYRAAKKYMREGDEGSGSLMGLKPGDIITDKRRNKRYLITSVRQGRVYGTEFSSQTLFNYNESNERDIRNEYEYYGKFS